jgi:hypothetical protein
MQEIRKRSALWHLLRTLRGAYQANMVKEIGHRSIDFNDIDWTGDALQHDYDFMQTRLRGYADRLRVLADKTREFGAEPVFVSQPSRKYRITPNGLVGNSTLQSYDGHEINGVDYYHMMRELDTVTEAVASEKDALFVDLAAHTGWVDTDFYDFAHMTPQGVEKVGVILWGALRDVIAGAETGAALHGDSAAFHPRQ